MPNIYKQQGFVHSSGSVLIPDVESLVAIEDENEETSSEDEDESVLNEEVDIAEESDEESEAEPEKFFEFKPAIMTSDEIKDHYRKELDIISANAAEKGYFDALNRKKGELKECMKKVDQHLLEMQQVQTQYMKQYAAELQYMAIEIAEKMIVQKIAEDDMILKKLIMNTMSTVKNSNWLNVEVSERLITLVDFLKAELAKPEYHGRADVRPLPCPDDTCRISTEDGTIVSTISTQADNLRTVFKRIDN